MLWTDFFDVKWVNDGDIGSGWFVHTKTTDWNGHIGQVGENHDYDQSKARRTAETMFKVLERRIEDEIFGGQMGICNPKRQKKNR